MQRFLAATLAAGICVAAGLVSATPAQAQTTHYGPGGGDGVEVWATPQAGGYQVEYNALNCTLDGDTRYPGFLQIVGTDGDKTYVQGEVVGGGATYTSRPASYVAPTQHSYDGVWATGERAELLNLNGDTPPANAPPTVSITAPSSGATYTTPASITITANASDSDGTVSKVEFYQGATKLGEDTGAPYSYTWSAVGAGSYSLTAKATDNGGATSTSGAVSVTVNPVNQPASVTIDSFTVSPSTITTGLSATLSWTTSNTTSVSIDQGIGGVAEDGTRSVTPGGTTTYTLTADGVNGPVTAQVPITVVPDTDGDGLPDSWETSWGLDPSDPDSDGDSIEDPDDDEDGDGFTNYAEYLAGSDPTDPGSHPGASDGFSSTGISCAAGPPAASPFVAALLLALLFYGLLLRRRRLRALRRRCWHSPEPRRASSGSDTSNGRGGLRTISTAAPAIQSWLSIRKGKASASLSPRASSTIRSFPQAAAV